MSEEADTRRAMMSMSWPQTMDEVRLAEIEQQHRQAANALHILYAAATRDPYCGDVGRLVDARLCLARALGLEGSE